MKGFGYEVPPLKKHVEIYFIQKGFTVSEANHFFNWYQNRGWKGSRGHRLTSWKVTAWLWIMKLIVE